MLRHMWRGTFIRAILLGAAVAFSACAGRETSLPATVGPADAPAADFRPVTDIPIPEGATMDTERSLILSSRDRWTGRVVMKVGLSVAKAFAFYQQKMPGFRWAPVMSVQSDISVLAFTREDRAATVQIQPRTLSGSLVTVTIAPRQADQPVTVQPNR
jgi:hypothetical protein